MSLTVMRRAITTFPYTPPPVVRMTATRDGVDTASGKVVILHALPDMTPLCLWLTKTGMRDQRPNTEVLPPTMLLTCVDQTTPRAAVSRVISPAQLTGEIYLDVSPAQRPTPGPGFLAGEFPGGITTIRGVPTTATIRVHYRPDASGAPGDGVLVAEVQSAADGTWRVDNLDPTLKFDVIGRKQGFRDVILPGLNPKPY